jgi:hypothetical protein
MNTATTDFVDQVSGITIKAGSFRRFETIQDVLEIAALADAINNGTLETDGHSGSTIWVFDKRTNFGSANEDSWERRHLNEIESIPSGISNISNDSFLLPAGYWSFSIYAAGKGNIRLVDATNNTVLATSADGDGIIELYGLVDIPYPVYVAVDAYLSDGDIDAPESEDDDADGTKYVYLAAKFVCVKA